MKKWVMVCMALMFLGANVNAQDDYEARVNEYIKQYRDLAIREQLRSGIPAAITLAQGIHETAAGGSELATEANNHFGIKCKKDWTGLTFAHTDDAPNECFRRYLKAEDSYTDHSDYLKNSPRYLSLFKCPVTDYKGWALGLKKCGYATNPHYAPMLIKIIEDYNLQEYTNAAIAYNEKKQAPVVKEIIPEDDAPEQASEVMKTLDASITPPAYGVPLKVNGLKAVYAKKGDMPLEYAIKNNIRYEKLLEFNEIGEKPLANDMFLYLEKKHTRGLSTTHKVTEEETLALIAQKEGIQLRSLRYLNMLEEGEEPVAGTVLMLQKQVTRKPQLIGIADNSAIVAVKSAETTEMTSAESIEPAETTEMASTEPAEITPIPKEELIASTENIATLPPAENTTATVLPAPDNSYISKEEVEEPATTEIGPPASISDIPPVEKTETTTTPAKVEPVVEELPVEQSTSEKPKSELDLLKSKFDKAVYAKPAPAAASAPQSVATEISKTEARPKEGETKEIAMGHTTPTFYIVKKGDTAFSIAKTHGISVSQLQEWNGLNFDAIKIGQKLRVKQ